MEKASRGDSRPGEENKKRNVLLEILGSIVMAAIGLYVYKATGLYSAADSAIVHVVLGGGIVSWFVLNFRVGLHQK